MDLLLSSCFMHYTKRKVLHVRLKLTLPFLPSKRRKEAQCVMLLRAWESNSLSCCQDHGSECEEQRSYQQQLLCHRCCKLGSPSSKRIASHRISVCLDHSHELLKSCVRADLSGTRFYGYPSEESSWQTDLHISMNFGLEVNGWQMV